MRSLEELSPTENLEIENGLALVARVKLCLTIHPLVPSVSKPIDEWQLKRSLIDFLKKSIFPSVTVPEEDIVVRRHKDLKKRKREEPVAHGSLFIRDLGFLEGRKRKKQDDDNDGERDVKVLEKKFIDWRKVLVEKMNGIELNLEGVKYNLTVVLPVSDDFERLKKDWEEYYAFGHPREGRREADTIVLRGVPSRWFAEPRVSSKPSMLVTHTIFSTFGKIKNLNVAEDDDLGKDADEDSGDLASGLHCKIVVQFEKYNDFVNAMKAFCGRSMQKEGTRLKADYELTWDKVGFFRNSRKALDHRDGGYKNDAIGYNTDDLRRKRFRE
ncbi:hypothetical protein EUTSA_v10023590mg [Eutrema salsugineum]|uniref:ZCW7 n=1 Tax=Eutrema salsugineum TaxID=72664 RepID=V4JVX6_EUTSA|nr:uncharacterized protein LOC18010191 [Eutrema salsugineum]ESQ29560.1 hypothetical protein EUTSA_v10023590mg [Eutrema salsugineum]